MPSFQIWAAEAVTDQIRDFLREVGLDHPIHKLVCDEGNWSAQLLEKSRDGYVVAVLPIKWSQKQKEELDPSLLIKLESGVIRIAFWGSQQHVAFQPSFPHLFLLSDHDPDILAALLQHLERASIPGIHTLLPIGAEIFSERLNNEKEIGRKTDKALHHLTETRGVPKPTAMSVRLALGGIMAHAFHDPEIERKRAYPPVLQIGASEKLLALSFKWRTSTINIQTINDALTNFFWKIGAWSTDGLLVHLLPETGEVEALMVFNIAKADELGAAPPFSLAIDVLTNERVNLTKDFTSAAKNFSDFKHSALEALDEPPATEEALEEADEILSALHEISGEDSSSSEKTTIAGDGEDVMNQERIKVSGKGGAAREVFAAHMMSGEKDPMIEVANLRKENERLGSTLANYKEQTSKLTKKLNETLELFKKAQQQAKSFEIQLKNQSGDKKAALLEKELELVKKRLDAGKQRESDLVKKLHICLEQLKKYQNAQKKKDAA